MDIIGYNEQGLQKCKDNHDNTISNDNFPGAPPILNSHPFCILFARYSFVGVSVGATVVYEISVKIRQAEKFASHLTKNLRRDYDFNFTTTIVVIMGRRLLDEVVYRIRLYIKANESVAAIIEAVKVSKKTIYKLQLNLNIWGKPYTLPIVTLGQYRSLLPY